MSGSCLSYFPGSRPPFVSGSCLSSCVGFASGSCPGSCLGCPVRVRR